MCFSALVYNQLDYGTAFLIIARIRVQMIMPVLRSYNYH
jgi:hypothetical protein